MRETRTYVLLALMIVIWGANYIVSRALSGFPPVHVSGIVYALFRYLIGALMMLMVLVSTRPRLSSIQADIRPFRKLLVVSAVLSAIFIAVTHVSVEYISSGTSSIIVNLNPIVVLTFGVAFLQERVDRLKAAGFLLGLVGALILLVNSLSQESVEQTGIWMALVGTMTWAAYTVTLQYLKGVNNYAVLGINHAVSAMIIIPFICFLLLTGVQLVLVWDMWTLLGFLYGGVLSSGLGYLLYFHAIERIGAARTSSFLFLIPFVSVVGDFILGEPPDLLTLMAGATAILGVGLIRFSRGEPEQSHREDRPV